MAIKTHKPITPSLRHTVLVSHKELSKKKPEKKLVIKLKKFAGRNVSGKLTVRHKGGGAKQSYRIIDFKRLKRNIPATVEAIEYDPYRTTFIALLKYADGERKYILSPDQLKAGMTVQAGEEAPVAPGNALPLKKIPQGTFVHAVEMWPGKGALLGRSAGTGIQVMGGDKGYVQLRLPSGEMRLVSEECYATIGNASNPDHKNVKLGKAGRARHLGIKPGVRGVAMSYKHPHGAGQGKSGRHGTGGPAKTPWGKKQGTRTRKHRKVTSKFIIKRRPSVHKFKKYKTLF